MKQYVPQSLKASEKLYDQLFNTDTSASVLPRDLAKLWSESQQKIAVEPMAETLHPLLAQTRQISSQPVRDPLFGVVSKGRLEPGMVDPRDLQPNTKLALEAKAQLEAAKAGLESRGMVFGGVPVNAKKIGRATGAVGAMMLAPIVADQIGNRRQRELAQGAITGAGIGGMAGGWGALAGAGLGALASQVF